MKKKRYLACLAGVTLVAASVGIATPASAESVATTGTATTVSLPMSVTGYDAAVAKANGFKVVTAADGTQQSVPVTAAAKAAVVRSLSVRSSTGMTTQGYAVVFGDCGSSSIRLVKGANNVLTVTTSYTVLLPQNSRTWGVVGAGVPGGGFNLSFNGKYTPTKTWNGKGTVKFVGPGAGHVSIGSHVIQIDGKICYSGNPGTGFD